MKCEGNLNISIGGEKERFKFLADQLDGLRIDFIRRHDLTEDSIPYVDWIVQDLRKGNWESARNNYFQQSDKYGDKREIKRFLEDNGIADKGIDWRAWKEFQSKD